MKKLNEIPVRVEFGEGGDSLLLPVLHRVAGMLQTLLETGRGNMLDLRREPLTADDIAELKQLLGRGEIDARLTGLGSSNVAETSVAGVWWITHFNEQGEVTGEFIEITPCPDLFKSFPDDLAASLGRLQDRISGYVQRPTAAQVSNRLSELGLARENRIIKVN